MLGQGKTGKLQNRLELFKNGLNEIIRKMKSENQKDKKKTRSVQRRTCR